MKTITTIAIIFFAILAGCTDKSNDTSSSSQDADKPTVALIMKSLANEFFVNMANGAEKHQQNHSKDYELIVNGIKNESDLAQQVALVDQMVAAGVDAIVIAPADSKAVTPALARARQAGVTVINIDNQLDADVLKQFNLNIPFIGPDNQEGAYRVGKHLASLLNTNDEVAILEGIPTAFNSQQRRSGFEKAASEAQLSVVTTQSAAWDQTQAAALTSAILIQYPNLKAIMCANDNMALGAVSAIEQAGKSGQVKVVGFDNISVAKKLVQEGQLVATADQHANLLAVYGIQFALEHLKGNTETSHKTTPVDLIVQQ